MTASSSASMTSSAIEDMEARLAVERELLEADTGMLSNEKEKLLAELSAKESALKAEVENRQRMAARISALESKLLCGNGESMVERTNEQQRVLEKRRADLAERRKAEICAAQELEAKEEQGEE